jgi:hypothetical protein
MPNHLIVPPKIAERFEVHERRNGVAILAAAHPQEWSYILEVLGQFQLFRSDVLKPGGRKSTIAERLDGHFTRLGWMEKGFDTKIVVDETVFEAPTHKVDCYKNRVALKLSGTTRIHSTIAISAIFACCLIFVRSMPE